MNTYDIVFIFPPTLTDEEHEKLIGAITHEIEKLGGTVPQVERMGRRPFARMLDTKSEGLYTRFGVKLDPAQVEHLNARMRLMEQIFRVQIRKLDGELPPLRVAPVPVAPVPGAPLTAVPVPAVAAAAASPARTRASCSVAR